MSGLESIAFHDVRVSGRTRWLFVELAGADGLTGVGEASLQGREAGVAAEIAALAPGLLAGASAPAPRRETGIIAAAALSGIAQAEVDLAARRRGIRAAELLGGARRAAIPLYANVNRRTRDRSPEGFAASARAAAAAGHLAFKIAPFDEVDPARCAAGEGIVAMRDGVSRVGAVREAVGGAPLMVDCHWRFDIATARALIDALAPFALHWLECPIAETPEAIADLRDLRRRANARDMLLAGCEELTGVDQNRPFAEGGAYDVMMPDVKYVGGPHEMLRVADLLARNGVAFSPHNPSGPICHAASMQVAAAAASFDRLEVQFDESPLFDRLASPPPPACVAGAVELPGAGGIGCALDPAFLAGATTRRWERAR